MNFASPLTDSEIETILIASGVSKRKRRRSLNLLTSEYVSKIRKTAEGHLNSWFKSGVPRAIWNKLQQDESSLVAKFNLHCAPEVSTSEHSLSSGPHNHHEFEVSSKKQLMIFKIIAEFVYLINQQVQSGIPDNAIPEGMGRTELEFSTHYAFDVETSVSLILQMT